MYPAAQTLITDKRIEEVEDHGERACRECRSRIPATATFSDIERKAFQRGWDRQWAKEAAMFPSTR